MEDLIPVVNKLQDVFNTIGQKKPLLDLPQIVVIGSQSSGKSSVLENIVGRGFLPRGSGICTRRPLVLQMYNIAQGEEEFAEFLHLPNRKFTDFDQVRREIEMETDRETGKNKGVSSKAIRLKVYSPHVLNLTLVDLPGITKVPVGDQPSNIEYLIRDMCLEYVSNPLSIILAVSPANADLANSDAIKLAREVDPDGDRTIGVLTKLDLVDDGVDALDALQGKIIPLKNGYIGTVNRSQAEINANTSIRDMRKKEKAFFLNHPSYRAIASRHGTEYLTKTLNNILLHHIRDNLPDLKSNVQKQLREIERELAALGEEAVDRNDRTAQGQLILTLLSKYSTSFVDSMEGRQTSTGRHQLNQFGASSGLYGGARLSRSFKQFSDNLLSISAFRDLSDSDIETAIMNATGPRPSLFVPELSFELLVKRQLAYLQEPAMNCVSDVYEILQEVADQSTFAGLNRFRSLQEAIIDAVNRILSESLTPTQKMIENLIKIEQAFINTSHPDFTSKLHMIRTGPSDPYFASENFGMRNSDSAASVSSLASEPARVKKSGSLDIDAVADAIENISTNGILSDDEVGPMKESAKKSSSNFMSFIFNERVNKLASSNSVPGTVALASQTQYNNHQYHHHSSSSGNFGATKTTLLPVTSLSKAPFLSDSFMDESEAETQIRIIKKLIESYLAISKKNVLDLTPKTIMFFLVNHVKENLHTELIRSLYKEELFDTLLREDEEVAQTREKYKETAKLLNKAMHILSEVREYKLK